VQALELEQVPPSELEPALVQEPVPQQQAPPPV
jgi:hypothetical protein